MKRNLQSVAALSVVSSLMGCAQIAPPAQAPAASVQRGGIPVTVAAGPTVAPGASTADKLFSLGRHAHAAGQLGQAQIRYTQALEMNPDHLGSLNALAVVHAQAGRTDEALKLFARAMQLAPDAAHVRNNMGYALLRAGRLDEADAALRQARRLDPSNAQTAQNLQLLAAEQGRMAAQAQESETRITSNAVFSTQTGPSPGHQLVVVAPNVLEFRLPVVASAPIQPPVAALASPAAPAAPSVAATAAADTKPASLSAAVAPAAASTPASMAVSVTFTPPANVLQGVRLEVSNGVGISNLARRTAERLAPTGLVTTRLTNTRPYRQARTEIQYLAGQGASAQALSARLPASTHTVAAARLERGVQIRLVLGHDVAGKAIAAWLDDARTAQEHLAERPQAGGWILV